MAREGTSSTIGNPKDASGNSYAPAWHHCVPVCFVATLMIASPASAVPWTLDHTFDDPTPTTLDIFGYSVAIDGNNVLIGASWDDTNGGNVGQAYLFDAISGNLLHTFDDPTVTTEDVFGWSVAIDGNNILVGASWDDTNGGNVGQAHLFTPEPSTTRSCRSWRDGTDAAATASRLTSRVM